MAMRKDIPEISEGIVEVFVKIILKYFGPKIRLYSINI
jgi:hypothetical protein